MRTRIAMVSLALLLAVTAAWPQAGKAGGSKGRTSTPEERAAVVDLAKKMEANPADESLQSERERLFKMLVDAEDIHVTLCADSSFLPVLGDKKYKYSSELVVLHLFANAAWVISNPDKADDPVAANTAATESVLRGYKNLLARDPKAQHKGMDQLIAKQQAGEIPKLVQAVCGKKKETSQAKPSGGAPMRVRVNPGVISGNAVSQVAPKYPAGARARRVQGSVVMKAVISTKGEIQDLQVVSGDKLLVDAAMEAVRQWRYRPYKLLNGEPVEVETTITVNFTLGGA